MNSFLFTPCIASILVFATYGVALAEKWQATTTASCPNCQIRELDRKLYDAVVDAAFRNNQPVTFISGNTKQLTYSLRLADTGADFFTSKDECQKATELFEAVVQEVFGDYNSGAKLKFKHQCGRGK
jgi:hypothetical protein